MRNRAAPGLRRNAQYGFSPNFVIKAEYHSVDGNPFADPYFGSLWEILNGLDESTDLYQIGAQFSF